MLTGCRLSIESMYSVASLLSNHQSSRPPLVTSTILSPGSCVMKNRKSDSHIQVRDLEGVPLDELAARLHLVAHEDREDPVGLDGVLDLHLQQLAPRRVHGRLPELLGVHLPTALVP